MKLSRIHLLVLAAALVVGPSIALADPSIAFHRNTSNNNSVAEVLGSDSAVIADVNWSTALPSAWNGGNTVYYIPTQVFGYLRDEADESEHEEADAVVTMLMTLMGGYANTATASIPGSATVGITVGVETSSWCGYVADGYGKCPTDCTPSDNPRTCSGCGCAGTKTFP